MSMEEVVQSFDVAVEYTVRKVVTVEAHTLEQAHEFAPTAAALAFAVPEESVKVVT